MLLQFAFKNYKSFRDEATLDLTVAEPNETPENELDVDAEQGRYVARNGEKVLRAAAIYGANGGGKSNVVNAFQAMRWCVLRSFGFGDDGADNFAQTPDFPRPFLFDTENKNRPTEFEVYFLAPDVPDKVYNYGFTVGRDGVGEEWFNVKNLKSVKKNGSYQRVFYRNTETGELKFSRFTEAAKANIQSALRKETLIVSLGVKLNVKPLKVVWDFFLDVDVLCFGSPVMSLLLSHTFAFFGNAADSKEFFAGMSSFVQTFDPSIVCIKREIKDDTDGRKLIKLYAGHKTSGADELTYIPLDEESDGTQKMLALYPYLRKVFDRGALLFVDELNARLHPLLQRSILASFLDPEQNPNGAQLVFTTHEPWLLDCGLLRRDEIWFVQKGDFGASTLYSLAEFDENGDRPNYLEDYLLGKYGAIPRLTALRSRDAKESNDER